VTSRRAHGPGYIGRRLGSVGDDSDMSDPNGPWQDYGPRAEERGRASSRLPGPEWGDDRARPPGDVLRAAAGSIAWRYRSAPLWARVAVDVTAAGLVLILILGVSLAVRRPGPYRAAAVRPTTSTTAPPTTAVPATTPTTVPLALPPPTTTTTAPPPTTAPRPATTAPRPPTTTPPPTEPPPPPTEPPPHYDDCFDAWQAGALPLRAGDPGYGPHLDPDGDGRACEWREGG
jgi:Excalibur calcium-binding domain